LNKKFENQFGENDKLSTSLVKTSDFLNSTNRWADVNIEFYSYILSIQNDFYVNDNDEIIFKKTNSLNKYNNLIEKWNDEGEIYHKAYINFQNFYVEFAKNARKF